MEYITSRANPLVVRIRKLSSSRTARRREGLFIGDGKKLLGEAIMGGAALDTVVLTQGLECPSLPPGVRTVTVPPGLMDYISQMAAPQGLLFLCHIPDLTPPERLPGSCWLALDGLQDPGNVGTIWRTADALGADGLLLTGRCADPFHPRTVRATMGGIFRIPVYEIAEDELPRLTARSNLPLYAAALREDAVTLGEFPLSPAAVVIGSEGNGISPALLAHCDKTLRIPMEPGRESLNAAAAATVILWTMYSNRIKEEGGIPHVSA